MKIIIEFMKSIYAEILKIIPGHFAACDSWFIFVTILETGLKCFSQSHVGSKKLLVCMLVAMIGLSITSLATHLAQPPHNVEAAPTAFERSMQRHRKLYRIITPIITWLIIWFV